MWQPLKDYFSYASPAGRDVKIPVRFHLISGHSFTVSLSQPDWGFIEGSGSAYFAGTHTLNKSRIIIPVGQVSAYDIL